jgi:hypothetical protein
MGFTATVCVRARAIVCVCAGAELLHVKHENY